MKIATILKLLNSSELTRSGFVIHNLAIVLFAAVLCLPCLIHGLPYTGDSTLHATYQHQFSSQFWNGEVYPRWMMSANKGYGSPIFLIQYPLPYWIVALLRPLTGFSATPSREARELGVFCFLVLATAGLSARYWLRKNYAPLVATTAALVYISLPFLLAFELYSDMALGQFTCFAWMPLGLAVCDSLLFRFMSVCALGITWALLVLSNLMTALMFLPLMIAYALTRRKCNNLSVTKCILSIILALIIGTCLAAVYLFPFAANLKLFNISALLNLPGYELSHHLSYVRVGSLHKPLVLLTLTSAVMLIVTAACSIWRASGSVVLRVCVSLTLGLGVLIVTPGLGQWVIGLSGLKPPVFKEVDYFPERLLAMALANTALGVFACGQVSERSAHRRDYTLLLSLFTICSAFILMLPWSAFLWHAVPLIGTAIQFPYRLGVLVTVAVTGLFAAALDDRLRREICLEKGSAAIPIMFMAIGVIACGIFTWRADRTWRQVLTHGPLVHADETRDVDHTYRTFVSADHLMAFANLIGAVPSNDRPQSAYLDAGAARVTEGQGVVEVIRENPRKLLVSFTVPSDAKAQIGLLYSPLWKVDQANEGSPGPTLESSADGLIEVPLPRGRHQLEIVFDVGWPERYGLAITYISIVFLGAGMLIQMAVPRFNFLKQRSSIGVAGNGHDLQVHE